jgi:hypothetical protein
MAILAPDNQKTPVSAEKMTADGGRLGTFSREWQRLSGRIIERPQYIPEEPEVVASGTDVLASKPAVLGADGRVVNMAKYRMEQAARAEIDAALHNAPESLQIEDLHQETDTAPRAA